MCKRPKKTPKKSISKNLSVIVLLKLGSSCISTIQGLQPPTNSLINIFFNKPQKHIQNDRNPLKKKNSVRATDANFNNERNDKGKAFSFSYKLYLTKQLIQAILRLK